MKLQTLFIAGCAAVLLAACGGGGGGGDAPAPPQADDQVPAGALASPAAFTQWAATIAPSEADDAKKLEAVTPPTSETDQPLTL